MNTMKIIDVPKSILDLIAIEAGAATLDWGAPEDIDRDLRPVESLDAAMLPEPIRDWVTDVSYRMQCPMDFVAVAALSMIGSVIGTACGIRPKQLDDWCEVPNLWGAVVAGPGRMKSPAISAALRPLAALVADAQSAHEQAQRAHGLTMLTRKLTLDVKKRTMAKSTSPPSATDLEEMAELAADIDEPKCRRFLTNDTTFEKLGELMSENPRGLLVMHDELMGLVDGFTRPGREGERTFYLSAWNGKTSHLVDRIGRGSTFIPRLCATVFGGIQPEKLERYLFSTQAAAGNDGFVQRFQLAVFPDDRSKVLVIDEAANVAAEERVVRVVRKLADVDYVELGAKQDHAGALPYFRFQNGGTQSAFAKWHADLLGRAPREDSTLMQEHLSKYSKLVPALCLIFHLIELADKQEKRKPRRKASHGISIKTLTMALRWAHYLESHARRIYGMSTDYAAVAAKALAKKIKVGELTDGFSERDVVRKEWSALRDTELVKEALRELEAANWIRRMDAGPKGVGRPPSPKYEINPAITIGAHAGQAPTKPTKTRRRRQVPH